MNKFDDFIINIGTKYNTFISICIYFTLLVLLAGIALSLIFIGVSLGPKIVLFILLIPIMIGMYFIIKELIIRLDHE